MLGPTDEVIHCGFQNGLWTELSVPEFPILHTCRIQVWAAVGQGDRLSSDSQNPRAYIVLSLSLDPSLLLQLWNFKGSSPPPSQGCLPSRSLFLGPTSWGELQVHWQQAQRTSPHCSYMRFCQSDDLQNTKQVSTELLAKERSDQFPPLPTFIKPLAQQEQFCSTLEPQPSPATASTFSSKTGNVELGLDSIAQHGWAQDFKLWLM